MSFGWPCSRCGEYCTNGKQCKFYRFAKIAWIASVIAFCLFFWLTIASAANFTGPPELVQAAEEWRVERAIFWTGAELPDWKSPCVLKWTQEPDGAGNTNVYPMFDGHGGSMLVSGSLNTVLLDVLPHEVDHAVRATILRKPIPRLLDEGASGLPEGIESQSRLRSIAGSAFKVGVPRDSFDKMEYPQDSDSIAFVYGFGFSFSEFVVERYGQERLLQLQAAQKPSQEMASILGVTPQEAIDEWGVWFQQTEPEAASTELVEFHSRPFCQPCQKFEKDWRGGLLAPYRFKQKPGVAPLNPTFYYKGKSRTGYDGPESLLAWLKSVDEGKPITEPAPFTRTPGIGRNAGPMAEIAEAKDLLLKLKADFEKFQTSGPIGKLAMVGELKGDVAEAKATLAEAKAEISAARAELDEYTEKGWPIWYALPAVVIGYVKRRYAGSG